MAIKKSLFLSIFVVSLVYSTQPLCANSAKKITKRGNKFYREKKFDQALQEYNKAQTILPNSGLINFNMGTAYYRKSNYPKAIAAFTKSLVTRNSKLEEKANYNIANTKYRQGQLKENTDLATAISLYRESLDYYQRAIELNGNDQDAKFNHEFVEKKMKMLMDKLKQQQKQKKTGKGKEGKKQQGNKQKSIKGKGKQKEKKKVSAGKKKGSEKKKQTQKSPQKVRKMSEKEARLLLENLRGEELKHKNNNQSQGLYPGVEKDW